MATSEQLAKRDAFIAAARERKARAIQESAQKESERLEQIGKESVYKTWDADAWGKPNADNAVRAVSNLAARGQLLDPASVPAHLRPLVEQSNLKYADRAEAALTKLLTKGAADLRSVRVDPNGGPASVRTPADAAELREYNERVARLKALSAYTQSPEYAQKWLQQNEKAWRQTEEGLWTNAERDAQGWGARTSASGQARSAEAAAEWQKEVDRYRAQAAGGTPPPPVNGGGGGPTGGGLIDMGGGPTGGGLIDMDTGGGPTGGGLIDMGGGPTGGGLIDMDTGGMGNSGVVYGPDGTLYNSAAAAVAAGVTNFSYSKPLSPAPGLIASADTLNSIPNAATGNANSGGLIANANQQLFNLGTPNVRLPPGVPNPFRV